MIEWHKFTKKAMPDHEKADQVLCCRDVGHDPFFTVVIVDNGKLRRGRDEFVPERRDRWTYVPFPD